MPGARVNLRDLRRLLTAATVAYLTFPAVIFLVGWLRPVYGIPMGLLVAAAATRYAARTWRATDSAAPDGHSLPVIGILVGLIPVILLVAISGAGGWGVQESDWLKHNAILKDLVERPWPVVYQTARDRVMLVYYTAYYLPSALAGKTGGWELANYVLFAWTMAGVLLAALWLPVLTRANAVITGIGFVFASGADVVGWALGSGLGALTKLVDPSAQHLERWADLWEYSSNVTLVAWVPQHAIIGWLGAALLADAVERDDASVPWLLLIGVAALWSPFAALGLAPLVLGLLVTKPLRIPARVLASFSAENLVGVGLLIVVGLYFTARTSPFAVGGAADLAPPVPSGLLPWIRDGLSVSRFVRRYVAFCAVEFLFLSVAAWGALRGDTEPRVRRLVTLLWLAGGMLLVLPLFRYGFYNDLVTRVSIPSLFIVWLAVLSASRRWTPQRAWAAALCVLLVLGLPTPLLEIRHHVRHIVDARRLIAIPPEASVKDIFELKASPPDVPVPLARQYLGSAASFFALHLAAGQRP